MIFILIIVAIVCVMVYRLVAGFFSKVKKVKEDLEENMGQKSRDYTGRRQHQYQYAGRSNNEQAQGHAAAEEAPRRTQTDSGEVIIDHRTSDKSSRKIFADDDGEYVDFKEE